MCIKRMEPLSIIETLGNNPELFEGDDPVDAALIEKVEQILEIKYPTDYRMFLELHGTGILADFEIYGLSRDTIKLKSIPNGFWLTMYMREKYDLPNTLIPFGFDGAGGFFCLDTAAMNPDGRCPVVVFYTSEEEALLLTEGDVEAADFTGFIMELLAAEFEEDSDGEEEEEAGEGDEN